MRQAETTFPKWYCAMPALNVTLSLIGWFESASANGHRACIHQVRSKQKSQFHKTVKFLQIHIIWHRNLLDMTSDVNSIMKVKEYRFHIPIYHIFWELQCAELPECIATGKKPPTETPECLPDIHEGPPNLAESKDSIQCQFVPPGGYWSDPISQWEA
jgi:hypothetical protein